jgi:hypothetical protein
VTGDVFRFGPFTIMYDWIFIGIAAAVGYILMKRLFKRTDYAQAPLFDKVGNALIIWFFLWKFSGLLYDPSLLWNNPSALLVMRGNDLGLWIGGIAAFLYIYRALLKLRVPVLLFADLLSLGLSVAIPVYSLLSWEYGLPTSLPWGVSIENPDYKYHPVNVYLLMITAPIAARQWRMARQLGEGTLTTRFLIFYGMALMAVTFFQPKNEWIAGLSGEQLLFLIMSVIGVVLSGYLGNVRASQVK